MVIEDCSNFASLSLEQQKLCSCLNAAQALDNAFQTYSTAVDKYNNDLKRHEEYKREQQEWDGNYGRYAYFSDRYNQIKGETKLWRDCVPWIDTTAGRHDDWCESTGGEGWHHTGQNGDSPCLPGFGRGVCTRTLDEVNRVLAIEKEPSRPPYVHPPEAYPSPPSDINIQCCTNTIKGAFAGNVTDVTQSCKQEIITKLQQLQPPVTTATSEEEKTTTKLANFVYDSDNGLVITLVFGVLITLSISVTVAVVSRKK